MLFKCTGHSGQHSFCFSFWIFEISLDFFSDFYRFVWAREGLEMVRRWIPLHLDQVSAQIDHSGSIWGPFLIVDFSKTHLGPKQLHRGPICVLDPGHSDSLGPCRPKADICGGQRPTFRGVWGGEAAPSLEDSLPAVIQVIIPYPGEVGISHTQERWAYPIPRRGGYIPYPGEVGISHTQERWAYPIPKVGLN